MKSSAVIRGPFAVPRRLAKVCGMAWIGCCTFATSLARADPPPRVPTPSPVVLAGRPTPPDAPIEPLVWRGHRFSTLDYFITGAGAAITLSAAIVQPRAQHSLSGGILFDEGARDMLRVKRLQNRYVFRDASDVGLSLAVTWPFFADALTTAWWYRGSREVAQEMALIDLETLAIAGLELEAAGLAWKRWPSAAVCRARPT